MGGCAGINKGSISRSCNSGNVTGVGATGGIIGTNFALIYEVYNNANEIRNTATKAAVGGIAGNQTENSGAYVKKAYNKSRVFGPEAVGGIVGSVGKGTVDQTCNVGLIGSTSNIAPAVGRSYSGTVITNSSSVAQSTMIGWSQAIINNKLGTPFTKKANSLPILNITFRNKTF